MFEARNRFSRLISYRIEYKNGINCSGIKANCGKNQLSQIGGSAPEVQKCASSSFEKKKNFEIEGVCS